MSVLTCLTCGARLYRYRTVPESVMSLDDPMTAFNVTCDCTDPLLQLSVRIDAVTTSITYGSQARWSEGGETFPDALWTDVLEDEPTPSPATYGPFGEDWLD